MNDIRDIKRTIDPDIVKKIFGNKANAIELLANYDYDEKLMSKKSSGEILKK